MLNDLPETICSPKNDVNSKTALVSSLLSVIGSTFIIVQYFQLPDSQRRKTLRRLLCYLSVMDLLASFFYSLSPMIISPDNEVLSSGMCNIQAIVTTFASMSSFLSTSLIGGYLYAAVSPGPHSNWLKVALIQSMYKRPGMFFFLACIFLPLVLVLIVIQEGR